MATISQATSWNTFSWMKSSVFLFEFHRSLSLRVQLANVSIGSGNGLAPTSRQAIIWRNVDPVHWRIYAALGRDELILTMRRDLYSLRRQHLIGIEIPIINLRRSLDRLMFVMGIAIPLRPIPASFQWIEAQGNLLLVRWSNKTMIKLDSTRRKASEICLRPPLDIYSHTFSR